MNKIQQIEIKRDELEQMKKEELKLKAFVENVKYACLEVEIERKLLKQINERLEELNFYEEELTRDLQIWVYS